MDKVQALMHYRLIGIEIWVYCVIALIGAANEIVVRTQSILAQSLLQAAARLVLQIPAVGIALAAIPGLGYVLHKAAKDTTNLPPTFNQRRLARKAAKAAAGTPPAAAALLPILIIASMALSGCAQMKALGIDLAQCALGQVPAVVTGITGEVENILADPNDNWQSALESVGKKSGLDALACAIKAVVHSLGMKKASLDEVGKRKFERGQVYLNRLGV